MSIDFTTATFKDFEDIDELDAFQRAKEFTRFTDYMAANGHMNYRLNTTTGCGPEMDVVTPYDIKPKRCVCFVSNDYLNFSQHPMVKQAAMTAIGKYGTGSGASPLIGGYFEYHKLLEEKIAAFYHRTANESVIFTTGYTANSATLLSMLKKSDIAIVDMGVHASVAEGLRGTNAKTFPHNNLSALEHILKTVQSTFRTKLVVVDGVYSQDGDVAPLDEMFALVKRYGAYLMVDDAHGIGVLGRTGRGVLEDTQLLDKVDIVSGTFSKALGHIGGYTIANPYVTNFVRFQSRQQIFSSTAPPTVMGIIKAIELIDEEPHWRDKLWQNINHFKKGLNDLGLDTGTTCSAIIPVKIGDPHVTGDAGRLLLKAGIFTNPILYPAVPRHDARIRMSIMATHTKEHLDRALEAFEYVDNQLNIAKRDIN
ncbi:aminotransferase class I/II-fold pyridoxal phosphate-dependent enzyme [Parapedobacter sp. ISTM3]|uniref:aminotransferase class I/II-fold pyridoxal phosphate-dependent enzyme n=1 Tax=Parapedobacter sp. ISTM3 TaxID=2800130 RepID=UPI0019073E7D|nr:aminotransferase class I/II-fold pyridoxal phosphate-dependent enzyme [Parapedobacter sp. ISTM3]MBK1439834.1 aminotransferase class I/II-fold pyridoxal phosphate-dependent enzyme [Parapedobacter sp. ISTM3]